MVFGKISSKGTVVIPSKLRQKYNIKAGNEVEFIDTEEGIIIVPVVPIENLVDKKYMKKTIELVKRLEQDRKINAENE